MGNLQSSGSDPHGRVKFLLYGKSGWIGGLLGEYLKEHKIAFEYGRARLEDRRGIEADIRRVRPTHVLNAAGVTGRPNVDWCETHQIETIRANVIGCLNLADVTNAHGIHMTWVVVRLDGRSTVHCLTLNATRFARSVVFCLQILRYRVHFRLRRQA